jgi:hypothetical protein
MIEKAEFTAWLEDPVTQKFLEVCKDNRDVFRNILEQQPFQKENQSELRTGCLIGCIRTFTGVLNTTYNDIEPSNTKVEAENERTD